MRGTKFIGVFAACGFILSFFAGLFSHSSILSVLLKALIFTVVFGLLGFGISVIFSKFLSDGNTGDFQGEYAGEASSVGAANPSLGQHVDITIQDEDLKPSESENHFVVGDNHQMLNDSDVRKTSDTESASSGFVPLRNFETVQNVSGTEAVIPSEAISAKQETVSEPVNTNQSSVASFPNIGSDGGIDTLPDMENFVFSDSSSSDSDNVSDAGTETDFVTSSSSHKKSDAPAEVQDAALMAKAISSVLSDENS